MVTEPDPDIVFKALADRSRRGIVEVLSSGPAAVHDLAARFDISRPAISKHLKLLREAGLVSVAPVGKENHYRIEPAVLAPVIDWLNLYWGGRLLTLKALAEAKQ